MKLLSEPEQISLLGVDYFRLNTQDGGDLYLTQYGLPFRDQLTPENWYEPHWFVAHRVRLQGTSAIYRVQTRPVRGLRLDLVVRFSRVGQEVLLDSIASEQNPEAEFNSPFEEFSLVMQLRAVHSSSLPGRIFTKKPLAIYVPAPRLEQWQTGRSESKMAAKRAQHPEVELDMLRHYVLLYGWIKGLDAAQVANAFATTGAPRETFLSQTTLRVIGELKQRGFRVVDMKPEHIVLRVFRDGSLLRQHNGNPAYSLVDYELLERLEKT